MILITNAEQVRTLFPSTLQKQNGTWVQQCKICGGTKWVLVNKTGIVGDFQRKRCKACRGKR